VILMIDNYDSFTYNLVQYLGELGEELLVFRNDQISIQEIEAITPNAIVLSPGPGTPKNAGICLEVVTHFAGKIPILGVCLGHQTIAEAFGGEVVRAERLMHGKTSPVYHDGKTIFKNLPSPFVAARYHSLLVKRESLPHDFMISAETEAGEIMAIRHRYLPVEGVQFHPESILSDHGMQLLNNFLGVYAYKSKVSSS
jgi:para-aminobenzoate synthetase component II